MLWLDTDFEHSECYSSYDMEPWVLKAMQRWPNVPAVFGWLSLDRRGRWLIKDELITRPQIVDTINANYGCDEHGRWFFQNGPQRGYMRLAYAPWVLRTQGDGLVTHTRCPVERIARVCLDEEGSLLLETEHGAGVLSDTDLEWALMRIVCDAGAAEADDLAAALQQPSDSVTRLAFSWQGKQLPIVRLDFSAQPRVFKFERHPEPLPNERVSSGAPD